MNREELAWAAGFIDGEGYFGFKGVKRINDKKKYANINLNIHQVDRRALDRVVKALGFGRVDGPYGPYSGNRQKHYQFVLGDFEHVQAAIAMLWEFLGPIKRKQAKTALVKAIKLIKKTKYLHEIKYAKNF